MVHQVFYLTLSHFFQTANATHEHLLSLLYVMGSEDRVMIKIEVGLVSNVKDINLNRQTQALKITTLLFRNATVDLCLVGPSM